MQPSQLISRDKIDAAYDELHAGTEHLKRDLEFAYKRAKVLADMLGIPVHESPEVTGTILGMVRGNVEKLIAERDLFKKETVTLAKESMRCQKRIDRMMEKIGHLVDAGADGCCKYCDIKTDIAREALEI